MSGYTCFRFRFGIGGLFLSNEIRGLPYDSASLLPLINTPDFIVGKKANKRLHPSEIETSAVEKLLFDVESVFLRQEKMSYTKALFPSSLQSGNINRAKLIGIFGIGFGFKRNLLSFLQAFVALCLNSGIMYEHILSALIVSDKAIPLFRVKPFYRTLTHFGYLRLNNKIFCTPNKNIRHVDLVIAEQIKTVTVHSFYFEYALIIAHLFKDCNDFGAVFKAFFRNSREFCGHKEDFML